MTADPTPGDSVGETCQRRKAMRQIGVICVALSIVLLIISFFPIIFAENTAQLLLGFGCMGLVAIPLFCIGIFLTRRVAAKAGPEGEAEASAAFLRKSTALLRLFGGAARVGRAGPDGNSIEGFGAFDLNSITVAGWLLVLATAGFILGEILLFRRLVPQAGQGHEGLWFLGGLLLAVVFFSLGRLLLKAFGVPFSKAVHPPDSLPPQQEVTGKR
jgi:hypothetical protein